MRRNTCKWFFSGLLLYSSHSFFSASPGFFRFYYFFHPVKVNLMEEFGQLNQQPRDCRIEDRQRNRKVTEKVDVFLAAPDEQGDGIHKPLDRQANDRSHIDHDDQRDPENHEPKEGSHKHQWGAGSDVNHVHGIIHFSSPVDLDEILFLVNFLLNFAKFAFKASSNFIKMSWKFVLLSSANIVVKEE